LPVRLAAGEIRRVGVWQAVSLSAKPHMVSPFHSICRIERGGRSLPAPHWP
jgi:hypothetical protein